MSDHVWNEMYNDTPLGILYGALTGASVVVLVIVTVLTCKALAWVCSKTAHLPLAAANAAASGAGKVARAIHNPDGKG